jgi:hypothetical protein
VEGELEPERQVPDERPELILRRQPVPEVLLEKAVRTAGDRHVPLGQLPLGGDVRVGSERTADEHLPARDANELLEVAAATIRRQVLEDVEAGDDVERVVAERQPLASGDDVRGPIDVEGGDPTVGQKSRQLTGTSADVQHGSGPADYPGDEDVPLPRVARPDEPQSHPGRESSYHAHPGVTVRATHADMRFLFATIQSFESDFYGTVGAELARRGHESSHLTVSRRSARALGDRGFESFCLPDLIAELPTFGVREETARIETQYGLPSIRDVYRTDPASEGRPEGWCVQRTVEHFLALEQLFDELRPDILVPEVGTELIRTVAHHVALAREVPTLFLFYTIFPQPLRLYVDTLDAPIVPREAVRPLTAEERDEVEQFIREFTSRRTPIRAHRPVLPIGRRFRQAREYVGARLGPDRDNDYLRPGRWAGEHVLGWGRAAAARALYRSPRPGRPFVYFPLHVTDDYKIKRVIPHCADQAAIVEQIADALPPGYDLVLKEHPLSIGRNPVPLLRRLRRRPNVYLVPPRTSTHDLIERSASVAVISSTVGLEALLYAKPVLTVGRPFYSGYGITLDAGSFADLRELVPAVLRFQPHRETILRFLHAAMRRCRPGAPVLVDRSDENALRLAESLEDAARSTAAARVDETALLA